MRRSTDPTSLVTPAWITPTLLALTVRVWSRRYGRPVDPAEALDLLLRVGRLMDVLASPLAARTRTEGIPLNRP